jgi:zinc-binding in reverse transcriptase
MRIQDLELQNTALLLRWWWRAHKHLDSLLMQVLSELYTSNAHTNDPPFWKKKGSFFWAQLYSLRPLFQACITYHIRDGQSISFWYDPWNGPPLLQSSTPHPRPTMQRIGLRGTADRLNRILPHPRTQQQQQMTDSIAQLHFAEGEDSMIWKLTKDGSYSTNSFYSFFAGFRKVKGVFGLPWKAEAPPSIKNFFYLLVNDRLLTQQVLIRRKVSYSANGCVMCTNCPVESSLHLFFLCPYAISVWFHLQKTYQMHILRPQQIATRMLQDGYDMARGKGASCTSLWSRIILAGC